MLKKKSKLINNGKKKLDLEGTFLLEKSLIGAYWNKLYDFGNGMASFHAMAELKQTAQPKNLMPHM